MTIDDFLSVLQGSTRRPSEQLQLEKAQEKFMASNVPSQLVPQTQLSRAKQAESVQSSMLTPQTQYSRYKQGDQSRHSEFNTVSNRLLQRTKLRH
jgi:hypothetical protein